MYYWVMSETENPPISKENIDRLMKIRGIHSYAELARRAGLNKSTITRLFQDQRQSGSSATISALANALETTEDFVRGKTTDWRKGPNEEMPEYALEIVEMMRGWSPSQRYELKIIADAFTANAGNVMHQKLNDLQEMITLAAAKDGRGKELIEFLRSLEQGEGTNNKMSDTDGKDDDDGDAEVPTK